VEHFDSLYVSNCIVRLVFYLFKNSFAPGLVRSCRYGLVTEHTFICLTLALFCSLLKYTFVDGDFKLAEDPDLERGLRQKRGPITVDSSTATSVTATTSKDTKSTSSDADIDCHSEALPVLPSKCDAIDSAVALGSLRFSKRPIVIDGSNVAMR